MNQQRDAQELELRAQIIELRRRIPELEMQQNAAVPRGFEPIAAVFYEVGFQELQRQRTELDNAERLYRATYPNLLERIDIQENNHEVQERLNDIERGIDVNERAPPRLQQLGEFPPDVRIVPPNPPVVEPRIVGESRRRRWEEIQIQYPENGPLERDGIPLIPQLHLPRPPPAVRQFPVAEAQRNPDIALPQFGTHQDFLEQILARQRRVEAAAHRENQDPENFIQVIRAENRQNQDEPRQEDQEGSENRNPEEQRQEEGPENQEDPENQPQN